MIGKVVNFVGRVARTGVGCALLTKASSAGAISKIVDKIDLSSMATKTMSHKTTQGSQADLYISKLMTRELPYEVEILGSKFLITDYKSYPPGRLAEMFGEFIAENELAKDKIVADIGTGSFALGIFASKNGAKRVLGTDINDHALEVAKRNCKINGIDLKNVALFSGDSVFPLLGQFDNSVDVILSGPPWDAMSLEEFEQFPDAKKALAHSLYDVEDKLMSGIMRHGFKLLSKDGKIFITSAQSHIERIAKLCEKFGLTYKIVMEKDIHKDGNLHYIVELSKPLE